MNPRTFNGIYRPLVQQAWFQYCQRRGISPNAKDAYTIWYQSQLRDITGGKLSTTKDASDKMQTLLIDRFKAMLGSSDTIRIHGRWSEAQVSRFKTLAHAAYTADKTNRPVPDFSAWLSSICTRNGFPPETDGTLIFPDPTTSFDTIMADLAVIAEDMYWLDRTSHAAETRMRWQIARFLEDIDFVDKRFQHDWAYVRSIYKQADLLPADIEDCPALILWKVLQMLDTHIRRLCKDFGIRPMDLPTRAHPHAHLTINEQSHHLHIGHALEHIPDLVHFNDDSETVPFQPCLSALKCAADTLPTGKSAAALSGKSGHATDANHAA